jgi:uncharacterized membrane protein (UPF0136 family)
MNRSISVTLTLIVVLMLTAWNLIKAWTALTWRDILVEFSIRIKPELTAVISIIWVVAGLILIWGILQKKVWSKKLLIATATGYVVWFWSERLIWQSQKTNLVFAIIINIILLIIIYFGTKSLSREAYERTIENSEVK